MSAWRMKLVKGAASVALQFPPDKPDKRVRRYSRHLKPIHFMDTATPIVNDAERKFIEKATARGFKVMKKGWPDFICVREKDGTEELKFVEVKASRRHRLSSAQQFVFDMMKGLGLDVMVWSPDRGEFEI